MYTVGRLNKAIYQCITHDIVTDEVIITEKQLDHIRSRHPEAFQNTLEYVNRIIQNPDYIIKDSRHNASGLLIKKISIGAEYILLVLRICTSNEPAGYKNSIITSWEISEQRLQNYLRNKTILYKKA